MATEDEPHNYIRQVASISVQMYIFNCTVNVAAAGFVCSNLGKTPFITYVLPLVFASFALASGVIYLRKVPKLYDAILEETNAPHVKYPKETYCGAARGIWRCPANNFGMLVCRLDLVDCGVGAGISISVSLVSSRRCST